MKTTFSQHLLALMAAALVTSGLLGGVDQLARQQAQAAADAAWAANAQKGSAPKPTV